MSHLKKQVSPEFVAKICDVEVADVLSALSCKDWPELKYEPLQSKERDEVILDILDKIDGGKLRIVGDNDNSVWNRGWGEILDEIKEKGFSPEILRPQYFAHHRIARLDGQYIDTGEGNFSYEFDLILRRVIYKKYLSDSSKIIELGCGTGNSQLLFAELFPDADLVASDWAEPSQGIIKEMAKYLKRNIKAVKFNMLTLEGWDELEVDENSSIVTNHALEQLGSNCTDLLDKIIDSKPNLCLHLEPISELYDTDNLFDYIAKRYHAHRNYLNGWLTALKEREQQGKIKIIEVNRLGFGGRDHEAYSVIAWKPL
ncbi:class I SAM-dependent methyltransferase [Rickettsiales bacterium]|nr:class I SAM-dependent methyltransferase [Rickettsiales bacterium]